MKNLKFKLAQLAVLTIIFIGSSSSNLIDNDHTINNSPTTNQVVKTEKKSTDIIQINLDDFKKDSWTAQEVKNAELVVDFVQHLMNNHDFEYVEEKFGNHPYTQHNRSMTDGMAGVIEFVSKFAKKYPEYTYDVKHIYVDGDYVIFHTHSTIKKKHRGNPNKGVNIFDTWKITNGQITEHWDSIQAVDGSMRMYALMTGGKKRNSNTLY